MPKVSVILLSYNQAEYLRESVESVLRQTTDDWELIAIDNGSTDESQEILRKFNSDSRVHLFLHASNQAPTRRLNEGIAEARGEFVSILYSDDYYLPDKLARQVALFESAESGIGVVYSPGMRLNVSTGATWQDPSSEVSGDVLRILLETIYRGGFINPIAPLIRRECFLRYPFHEDIFIEGECVFLYFAMTYHFLFDATPTVVMRDHERNAGRSLKKNLSYFIASLDKLEVNADFPKSARPALQSLRVRAFLNCGWQGIRVLNEPEWARSMFMKAVRLDLRQVAQPKVLAGLGLSLLPKRVRTRINESIYALRRPAGHSNYVP